jgi:hypothetical protein
MRGYMRAASFRVLALASLASLAMATPGSAVTILQFGQTNPSDFVTAVASATSTTLNTSSSLSPQSIPVLITNIGGTNLATPLPAFETFQNVTSTGTATTTAGTIEQLYSGTIAITAGPNATGGNFLTATFQNAVLSGSTGGGSASLVGSRPPQNVTFTSNFAAIVPLIAGNPPENFSISFSNLTPPLAISGSTIAGFTGQNTGTFATGTTEVIPEPSGLVMAGMAVIAGLGCCGWRRRRA